MKKNALFTICAKNYLAQALTLKLSALQYEDNVDFYIILADEKENLEIDNLYTVEWLDIPHWRSLAFKYNVIEFSTAIKPYSFSKLFELGYDKVLYLDPDLFMVSNLDYIWESLENKSIILTPHYLDITETFNGAVEELVFNRDGIFNCGFVGIRNTKVGSKIVRWWCSRLYNQCYIDMYGATFTDQKWMDFIPGFFPKELEVCRHFGVNVAIWNLHERELINKEGIYYIKQLSTGKDYPLVFYHFSGFDPFEKNVINRRHPDFTVKNYPSFAPLIEDYRNKIYKNGYDEYSVMEYSYDHYNNGRYIPELNRRLYRTMLEEKRLSPDTNPFDSRGLFYLLMKEKHLLSKKYKKSSSHSISNSISKGQKVTNIFIFPMLKFMLRIIGVEKYELLIGLFRRLGHIENNRFLIK